MSHQFIFIDQTYRLKLLFLITFSLILLFPPVSQAQPQTRVENEGIQLKDPGADLWRMVRQREQVVPGTSQVKGVETGILINTPGDRWTQFRVNELAKYAPYVLGAVLLLILLFYLIRGRIRVKNGFSGSKIHRFSDFQRVAHWVMASLFIFLGVTGLILLLGRNFLIPLFGHEVFSILASASKEGHNLFGVLFLVSLLMMLFMLAKKNLYEKGDLKWLATVGGAIGKSHPRIGFFNAGEKVLFWLVVLLGLVISVSGIILVFPNFEQGRVIMGLSHVTHSISAIALIALTFGHMYMGSLGTEGAFDSMKSGYVDANWAQEHHDLWAEECREKGLILSPEDYAKLQGEPLSMPGSQTSTPVGGKG